MGLHKNVRDNSFDKEKKKGHLSVAKGGGGVSRLGKSTKGQRKSVRDQLLRHDEGGGGG